MPQPVALLASVRCVRLQRYRSHAAHAYSPPGISKRLFTHSYLGYGFDVLEARMAAMALQEAQDPGEAARAAAAPSDPCLPKG